MINFQDFVNAHLKWRSQLAEDKDKPGFDIEKIRRDNLCEIGKWFYGPGQEQFGDLAEFDAARQVHAKFHAAVACSLEDTGHSGSDDEFEDLVVALKLLSERIVRLTASQEAEVEISDECKKAFKLAEGHISAHATELAYTALSKLPCESCLYEGHCDDITRLLNAIRNASNG
ncbi:CZB domain-containing protein [Magnetovibrio sp. PR-2]|uniref:CZB domain-containing protein n=1 Tax=Magnetovibrio sp. PR-2 TaxID=3120356 RepID=UPI002FCE1DAA